MTPCACVCLGAGWGGCAVFLVTDSNVADFMLRIADGFYGPRVCRGEAILNNLDKYLFASRPECGATTTVLP